MKFACSSLLVLISLSASSAEFWLGSIKHNSEELVQKIDTWKFEKSKCQVIHFNTCREYNMIIDSLVVETMSGIPLIGRLLHGGEEDFYVGVELCGYGETTFKTRIWGHFRGLKQFINVPSVFLMFDRWWDCNHPVTVY